MAAVYTVPFEQQWVSRIHKALKAAEARGEIEYKASENVSNADYERVMREYATGGNQLIVGEAFAVEAAARKVAKDFPKTSFLLGSSGKPQAPNFSDGLNYLYISSRVLADDLPGAHKVIDSALEHPEDERSRVFALASLMSINELDEAAKLIPEEGEPRFNDINIRLSYATLMVSEEDFHSAIQLYRESLEEAEGDAEISQQLAAALIGEYGSEDAKAREALKQASSSTRMPRSEAK